MVSTSAIFYNFWLKNTALIPSDGGTLIEGAVGMPQYINPILSQTSQTNEIDPDITKLIFSPLFTIDGKGKLTNDIAKEYSISEDKKSYTIKIKNDIRWHDWDKTKENLTADDVIFTVKMIQDPAYQSPLRANLVTVDVEKIDNYTIKFSLKTPYEPFLQNLTFGILPKHIWKDIDAKNASRAFYPIGSGPYKFEKIASNTQGMIVSVNLAVNPDYYGNRPHISKIIFKFYKDQEALIKALNEKEINATAYFSYDSIEKIKRTGLKNYSLKTPRYFTILFNQDQAKALADKNVRLALNYLTDKDQIIKEVLYGNGQKTDTPIPPILSGYNNQTKIYNTDPSYANSLLEKADWTMQEDNFRTKLIKEKTKDKKTKKIVETIKEKIPLEITLTTAADSPEMRRMAPIIQQQWQKGGVKVNLEFLPHADIQSSIRDRNYDALLFGETLGLNPDPFIFWHSSGTKEPGLNLSLYSNKDVDNILENYRQTFEASQKNELLSKFQTKVVDDAPAVFLFSPYINYSISSDIKGVDAGIVTMPADRFNGIASWYITTKRVWKK